jgi:hypothetical protein
MVSLARLVAVGCDFDCSILEDFSTCWLASPFGVADGVSSVELGFALGFGFQALAK